MPTITEATVLAAIGGIVTIVTTWLGVRSKRQRAHIEELKKKCESLSIDLEQSQKEINLQKKALDISDIAKGLGSALDTVKEMSKDGNLGMFSLLRAWNGCHDPKYISAYYQWKVTGAKPESLVSLQVDDDIVNRLIRLKRDGTEHFHVASLADCEIKAIYDMEGMKTALWAHISTETYKDHTGRESVRHTMASFCTSNEDGFTSAEITKLKLLVDYIRSIARDLHGSH